MSRSFRITYYTPPLPLDPEPVVVVAIALDGGERLGLVRWTPAGWLVTFDPTSGPVYHTTYISALIAAHANAYLYASELTQAPNPLAID